MKQTAVEWLVEKALDVITMNEFNDLLSQAIEMEKGQIIEAFQSGSDDGICMLSVQTAEHYYNETYKNTDK